jgi:hypothetical protein
MSVPEAVLAANRGVVSGRSACEVPCPAPQSPYFNTLGLSVSEFELTPGERNYLRDARIKAGGGALTSPPHV